MALAAERRTRHGAAAWPAWATISRRIQFTHPTRCQAVQPTPRRAARDLPASACSADAAPTRWLVRAVADPLARDLSGVLARTWGDVRTIGGEARDEVTDRVLRRGAGGRSRSRKRRRGRTTGARRRRGRNGRCGALGRRTLRHGPSEPRHARRTREPARRSHPRLDAYRWQVHDSRRRLRRIGRRPLSRRAHTGPDPTADEFPTRADATYGR